MRIDKVEFKNFNSYGNNITQLEFRETSHMFMLIGLSGQGKSTLREVITYAYYGKVPDKNLGDLPNRVNKNLYVKLHGIATTGERLIIERGYKPALFKVSVEKIIDGEKTWETIDNARDVQKILEEEYLKIPQSTFDNIISISIDKFKSFLTMTPKDKRLIIDQIFGILFFNKVNKNIKDIISNQKKDIVNLEGQVNVLNNSKNDINEKLEKLNEDNSSELNAEIDEITNKLSKFIEHEKKFEPALEKLRTSYEKVAKKHAESSSKQYEHKSKLREINEKIDLFNQDICPTCGTDFTSNEFREILNELEVSKIGQANILSEYDKSLVDLKADMSNIKEKETALRNKQQKINNEIFSMRNRLSSLKNELKKDDTQFDDILAGTIEKIDELLAKIEEKTEEKAIYDKLSEIFGEDGIKLQIVKNFLPEFNETINEFCKKLHFPYRIHIDEKFNTRILAIGEDISAKTLSTGETRKANFAVLISLIKIMKKNYPSINLLFLDEILASIDGFGVYEMLKLIKDVVDELELNAFVINHSELPTELFDTVCSVKKTGGFSQMEIYDC